jgi:outer membrane protein TolC
MAVTARISSLRPLAKAAVFFFPAILEAVPAIAWTQTVDFPQAVERALRGSPSVAAAGFGYASAREDVRTARGYYLPELVFGSRFVRTDIPAEAFALTLNQGSLAAADFSNVENLNNPPPRNDYVTTVTLEQPVFVPSVYVGNRIAKAEAEASGLDLTRTREETVYQVLTAYLDVLTARSYAAIAEQDLSDAKEHLRTAEALEGSGMGLASDVLRAKVFVASAESARVGAESRLEVAQRRLSLAMGEADAEPVDVTGPPPEFPDTGSLEELQAAAKARPDLRAASVRVANAGNREELRKAEYLPSVGFLGAYQVDAESNPFAVDNRSWKVGVGLKWNLFDGMRREAGVSRAASERRKAEEQYRGERDNAAFQVADAYLGVRDARRRSGIVRAAVASAEEGLRLIRARYGNQLARLLDVLDAQTALNRARADAVKAENDLRQSRARLMYVSGTLLSWAWPEEKEAGR